MSLISGKQVTKQVTDAVESQVLGKEGKQVVDAVKTQGLSKVYSGVTNGLSKGFKNFTNKIKSLTSKSADNKGDKTDSQVKKALAMCEAMGVTFDNSEIKAGIQPNC